MSNRETMQLLVDALHYGKAKLEQLEQEPTQWRDMVVVSLVREGINKHRARELADHFAAQPEPVACRFCFNEKGCWAWQCYSCGEIDDVQKPTPPAAQPAQEPVATLFGSLPVYDTTPPAAQPAQEPVGWEHHEYRPYGGPGQIRIHAVLASQYRLPDGSVSGSFQWLVDEYKKDKNTIKLIPLYTTPPAAQRPWVGLTKVQRDDFADEYGSYQAVCAIEQALKERNNG